MATSTWPVRGGGGGGGSGDVVGPGSSTDNAIARFDGITGKLLQDSLVLVDDLGNITGVVDFTTTGNMIVGGDLTVNGTTTTINTTNLDVEDANITINNGGNDASAEGSGLTVERTGTDGSLVYEDALASKWKLGSVGAEVEVVTVSATQTLSNKTLSAPAVTGDLTTDGLIDGRDVATDGTKLDGIEAGADVTDNTNVLAALVGQNLVVADIDTGQGATEVYAMDQAVRTTDDVTFNSVLGQAASSGATAATGYDQLVSENSGNAGLSILSGTTSIGAIRFGDSGDNDIGGLQYDHNTNTFDIFVNAASRFQITSAGVIDAPGRATLGSSSVTTAHDFMVSRSGANAADNAILNLKNNGSSSSYLELEDSAGNTAHVGTDGGTVDLVPDTGANVRFRSGTSVVASVNSSGQFLAADGSNSAPGLSFLDDTDTGFRRDSVGSSIFAVYGGVAVYGISGTSCFPGTNNSLSSGESGFRWTTIYLQNSPDVASDRNIKENISATELGLGFIEKLNPVQYNMKDLGGRWDSTLRHGLIAQEVEQAMNECGVNRSGFYGLRPPEHDKDIYSLSYEQFISPLIRAVQELSEKVKQLESK